MNLKLKFRIMEIYRTQNNFARACGRKENWISRIISNRQNPTKDEIKLICSKLKITHTQEYFPEQKKLEEKSKHIIEKAFVG